MSHARRTDNSHATIRDGLRDLGFTVIDVHDRPGMLDLMVSYCNRLYWLEVKNGPKDELTEAEQKIIHLFPLNAFRVESLEQAIELIRQDELGG
jgi:hypothetical protein